MEVPFVDVALPLEPEAAEAALRPLFDRIQLGGDKFEVKRFTEGTTNLTFRVCTNAGEFVARVNGPGTELIIDREREWRVIARFAAAGLCAPIETRFANGLVSRFVAGRQVRTDEVWRPPFTEAIARKLAALHRVPLLPQEQEKSCRPFLTDSLLTYAHRMPTHFADVQKQSEFERHFDVSQMHLHVRRMVERLEREVRPLRALCHNDLVLTNVLVQEGEGGCVGGMHFIDFEYACPGHPQFDVAQFTSGSVGLSRDPTLRAAFDDEDRRRFLRTYLHDTPDATPAGVELWLREVKLCEKAAMLLWAVWALSQAANSPLDFDFLGYAVHLFALYDNDEY